jgi:ATP-dependent Lhr-like helicase
MERMSCFCAPAALWETDFLPARLTNYDTSWLDTAMQESDLMWLGCGREKVFFCFDGDLELMHPEDVSPLGHPPIDVAPEDTDQKEHSTDLDALFPDSKAGYDFGTLLRRTDMSASELSQVLWAFVWKGIVSNDTVVALGKGIENKFAFPKHFKNRHNQITGRRRMRGLRPQRGFRPKLSKWTGALPFSGSWRITEKEPLDPDLLEAAERSKERIRLLLERYGILFRELLLKEHNNFQWRRLFRSLRLMELSGEIVSGYFFTDIPGPQFMSHSGFQVLQRLSPGREVYWLNALDPASMCGTQVKTLKDGLPRRLAGTHLVYCGDRLVLVSQRSGRELTLHVEADDPEIQSYLGVLRHLLTRRVQPLRQITVELINGAPAAESPYADALRISFDVSSEYKQLKLYRKDM